MKSSYPIFETLYITTALFTNFFSDYSRTEILEDTMANTSGYLKATIMQNVH